jgi:hypothetical protein
MNSERRLKQHRRYIFYRIYTLVVWGGGSIWIIYSLFSVANNQGLSIIQGIGFAILFPCFGAAVIMIMSIFVFPFDFSIFGHLERTHFPSEKPILEVGGTWGMVGIFRGTIPFFSWLVFPSGLGISILGMGKVFIPAAQIRGLSKTKGLYFFTKRYKLEHSSPELYGPVYFGDSGLFDALKALVP